MASDKIGISMSNGSTITLLLSNISRYSTYICFYNLSLVSWHGTRHYYVNKFMAIISGSSHIARFAISFRPTFPSYLEWFLSWQKWLVFVFFETIHVFLMLSCQFSVKELIIIIQEGNFVSF